MQRPIFWGSGRPYDGGHAKREFPADHGLSHRDADRPVRRPRHQEVHRRAHCATQDEDLPDLCVGLLDIAVLALGDLSDETGTTPQEWLQDLALQVQSDS